MHPKITLPRMSKVYLGLQSILCIQKNRKNEKIVEEAMEIINGVMMDTRRKAIFEAGAKARKPEAKFEHRVLGSMEAMNFYDGYASTHPGFENPYRRKA